MLMLVNASGQVRHVPLDFDGNWKIMDKPATETVLIGETPVSFNTLASESVQSIQKEIQLSGNYEMAPFSFSVLRIPAVPV